MAYDIQSNPFLKSQAFVNGAWISTGKSFDVTDPATGKVIGSVPDMSAADVRGAIEAAEAALPSWSALNVKARAKIMRKWAELVMEHQEDLAYLMTVEQGKPLAESRGEIAYGASFLEWFGEEAKRAYGRNIPSPVPGSRILTIKQPVGVCAAITPWNFPSAMITRKAGPALAAGCTMVLKPASETPFSALALAELAQQAGVPKGVFNVVTSSDARSVGKELCENPSVRKLSFTGSTEVGKILMAQCAGTMKKLSLELGGNAPFIVFDDADLEEAVKGAIACKYRNAGQTCVCANRIYVQEGIYNDFLTAYLVAVEELKIGNGLDEGVQVGPMINTDAIEKVQEFIEDAKAKGANVACGGEVDPHGRHFFKPTILTNVNEKMKVGCAEIFGPVAPVYSFTDEADVIAKANNTRYGLAAYFYARDIGRIWRVAEALEFGMVAVNSGILSNEVAPFGGIKESGVGREGAAEGLDEYMELKYIMMAGIGA